MSRRLFAAEDVDRLVPRLSELMEAAMERHRQATTFQRQLQEEQQHIRVSGGGLVDQRDWKARAERLDGLGIEVRGLLREIQALGGEPKDLEMGLVDFPGRMPGAMGGETVNLCWKYGEPSVRFWHGLDEGYAQRKPLP